ncbi:helix-turn-helix domain-containing protein [Streptomyces sp. NPDC060131]|uniref:helix-turn-helix domain-containing protein n=1 Tax=unclassified Streptomyces TaxID=2593676 RepID=UPI00365B8BF6
MSTDYQQARVALGVRLRELRLSGPDGRLTGSQLAALLGWPNSKISKLEHGRQTATPEDLRAWAEATGHPDAYDELASRLRGFESHIRSWRRQLANGHRPVQDTWNTQVDRSHTIRVWEESVVAGMLQTPDYAHHIFTLYAELHGTTPDTEAAVRSRTKRQEWLYRSGRKLRVIMWEAALHALVCPPPVLATQLDRLAGVIGMDTVELGIVPFSASLKIPAANGFWIFDDRLVITEDWHAELWVDDNVGLATYLRVWDTLNESAVYDAEAHRIITRAARMLSTQ